MDLWQMTTGEDDRPFFQTPLNPESQIVSLSPEGLVIICFIIPP